jgi:uncharacterized protein (DUF2252 family)
VIIAMPPLPPLLTSADRKAAGHARRGALSRSAHADWTPPPGRADPVATLKAQDKDRIPALRPLRHARMAVDAFAFLRGAAAIMAADLGSMANTGISTQLSGDCHLANFGATAGVNGDALFDLNDFDETLPGPFEWDVKRLAASLAVAGRVQGLSDKACRALARRAVHSFRREIASFASASPLDTWHSRIELGAAVDAISERDVRRQQRQHLHQAVQSSRDGYKQYISSDGSLRLPERPPAIFRLGAQEEIAHGAFLDYLNSLPEERRTLISRYRLRDVAFKAVGVGSVGTFCAIGLFANADGDTLLLQLKEAKRSVLAAYAGPSVYNQQGQRVVVGQRVMQAEPDLFLGWSQSLGRDFYVRRLKDSRLAAVGTDIEATALPFYAKLCGRTLARAQARTGDAAVMAGYLGDGDSFDEAVAQWAISYSEQNALDYARFRQAITDGEIEAVGDSKQRAKK